MIHLWHDINPGNINDLKAVVEISKHDKNKYELDKESGTIILSRVLHTAFSYPANYGFVPQTYAKDKDPLDILILGEAIMPFALVEVRVIGLLKMYDDGKMDDKVLAVPRRDPLMNEISSIKDLPSHSLKEIEHFFKHYKDLEDTKTNVIKWHGPEKAKLIIKESLEDYKEMDIGKKNA